MYIYVLIIGVILAVIGLAIIGFRVRQVARRIHPSIKKYFVISLNVAEIKQNADARDRTFPLRLGKSTVNVLVEPEPISEEGTEIVEIQEDGETIRQSISDTVTYAGRIVGAEETSDVRLTITNDMLAGYVIYGEDWWFIEPLKKFRIDADISDYLVYRTKDLRFKFNLEDDVIPVREEQTEPGSLPELPEGSGYLPPPHQVGPNIGILLVADPEYEQQAKTIGTVWHQEQMSVLHTVNGLYKKNLGCWFTPKVWILNYKDLKNCNADKLLVDLEKVVKSVWGDLRLLKTRMDKNAEVAHLTSGKDLDGSTLGIAYQPGVYSLSQQQLFWLGGGGGFGGPPNLAFQNMMIMAHELGHNFNGLHEEADEWCVTHFIWCWDYERSLMWPTFYEDNNDWISDGSLNAKHNNRQRIKNNMASGRNHNF
ncbi:hypothetical protein NIES593_19490 [Hydrococcus rivularis NIES-593]|uniref:Peptidase M12B domain-containing protein n=1 Tax=Hydrococcus rivularis NIES-593 TaxID=1921803 RepID=A0A1U7H9T5_9CYAN|nr:M12 family metallo-peptidase [Hydrococcus rivularis]OKH20295.1 hypothetical protein NIES593_19490 [Hydrococcus rivularis NIES-593]